MQRIGTYLLILGVGAFILPMFGLQFRLLNALGDSQTIVAGVLAAAGVVLIAVGVIRSRQRA